MPARAAVGRRANHRPPPLDAGGGCCRLNAGRPSPHLQAWCLRCERAGLGGEWLTDALDCLLQRPAPLASLPGPSGGLPRKGHGSVAPGSPDSCTPLFAWQVWRNHAGLVEALLDAGADPDARDNESGWSPLHRALHGGQLRIAAALLAANASLSVPDWRGRSPLDLLSAELKEYLAAGPDGAADGDVFAWGECGRSAAGVSVPVPGSCSSAAAGVP